MGEKTTAPQACPHCGNSIAYLRPVGIRTLEAARKLMYGCATSTDIAAALGVSMPYAAILLRRAERAGIIAIVKREKLKGNGGAQFHYEPTIRLKAFLPDEYRTWRKVLRMTGHNKAA